MRRLGGRHDDVDGSIRTVGVAFLANLTVAMTKYVGFFLSGTSAMLAESGHSTAVTVNQGLLLRGRLRFLSERRSTAEHPFGSGQERYFWAFIVAVVMLGIGAVASIGRGVLELAGASEEPLDPIIPFATLSVGLLMDGWSFLIGLLLATVAFVLAREMKSLS